MKKNAPQFHSNGLNILDPNDNLGFKSKYITLVQQKALMKYLPEGYGTGLAVDLGCGYGRLSPILASKGWRVIGIDPDENLLEYAHAQFPSMEFCKGGLPHLPLPFGSVDLLLMHNLLRPLLIQMGKIEATAGLGQYIAQNGLIAVVDNIRKGHLDYVSESKIIEIFKLQGLRLQKRINLRAARWWLLYLIRYGFVPISWMDSIAEYELKKRAKSNKMPRWQYTNVMFIFKKNSGVSFVDSY